jgi:uncharacterized membrane protein
MYIYIYIYIYIHTYFFIHLDLCIHKSLYIGAISALLVGFGSFAVSYRFGVILILFYYSSSKLTKVKEDIKAKLEDGYVIGIYIYVYT